MKIWVASLVAATALGAEVVSAATQPFDVTASALEVLWSTPILPDPPAPEVGKVNRTRGQGFVLRAATSLAGGQVVVLADQFDPSSLHRGLLVDAERHGPEGGLTELGFSRSIAAPKSPWPVTLASNGSDILWLGGSANAYMGIGSDSHADAFLAKLDISGRRLWERTYRIEAESVITGIVATRDGQVAVVSPDSAALILVDATDGHVIWQRQFGRQKGSAVVSVDDGKLMLASIEAAPDASGYREDVTVRTATLAGQISQPAVIRRAINTDGSAYYGFLHMVSGRGAAFVISRWAKPFSGSPEQSLQVASVSASGALLWTTVLSESSKPGRVLGEIQFCSGPAIAVLPDGDALVACALDGVVHLHRLDHDTGADRHGTLLLPPCNDVQHPLSLFLFAREDGTILLSGARSVSPVGSGCSWMARVVARPTGGGDAF